MNNTVTADYTLDAQAVALLGAVISAFCFQVLSIYNQHISKMIESPDPKAADPYEVGGGGLLLRVKYPNHSVAALVRDALAESLAKAPPPPRRCSVRVTAGTDGVLEFAVVPPPATT